jgi:hypothetical protein
MPQPVMSGELRSAKVKRKCSNPSMRASWRVFFTCWITYTVFWTPYIVREHFPAITLAESGTLNVQRFLGYTDDIFPSARGGAFINNNPGASITGAIPLFVFRPLIARVKAWNLQQAPPPIPSNEDGDFFWRTVRERLQFYFLLVAFLTVAFVMAPITAGAAAFFCARLQAFGISTPNAVLISLLYAFATPIFFRAALLNHNMLVCNAAFIAFLLLWDPLEHPSPGSGLRSPFNPHTRPLRPVHAALAGLLAGYCVLCDWSGVVVLAATSLYCFLRTSHPRSHQPSTPRLTTDAPPLRSQLSLSRLKTLLAFAAGAAVCIIFLAIYQRWAFGSPALPSQHYMPPTAPTSHGYRGFDWPSPALAWANFFDPRFGLFAYCPLLMLGLAAPFIPPSRRLLPPRELWILFFYFVLFVLFCAANQYSWLQPSTGFRYLVPVVPPLFILSIEVARHFPRPVQWFLAVCACAQSLILAAAHVNDVRLAVGTLVARHGQFFWMIRLRDAGITVDWWYTLAAWSIPFIAAIYIWTPWIRLSWSSRSRT